MGPTRRCRRCEVAWTGTDICWYCNGQGDHGNLLVSTGPNVAAGWPMDNIEDFVWGVW